MKQSIQNNSGFVGGAYTAMMLLLVAALAGLVTTSAQTAKKINTTQTYLATSQKVEKLVKTLISQYTEQMPDNRFIVPKRQNFGPNGQLNLDSVNADLTTDINGQSFFVCAVWNTEITGPTGTQKPQDYSDGSATPTSNSPAMAVIMRGENGEIETSCSAALQGNRGGDDRVRLVNYGEVLNGQDSVKLKLIGDIQNLNCSANQTVNAINDESTGSIRWVCRDNLQQFTQSALPVCQAGERLVAEGNGQLVCTRDYAPDLQSILASTDENMQDSARMGSFCYGFGDVASVKSHVFAGVDKNDRKLWDISIDCRVTNMESFDRNKDVLKLTMDKGLFPIERRIATDASCANYSIGENQVIGYLSHGNTIVCLENSGESPLAQNGGCNSDEAMVLDRLGRAICMNFKAEATPNPKVFNACPRGQTIISRSSQDIRCASNDAYKDLVMPQADEQTEVCAKDTYVVARDGEFACVEASEVAAAILPEQSCQETEYITWDGAAGKLICARKADLIASVNNGAGVVLQDDGAK